MMRNRCVPICCTCSESAQSIQARSIAYSVIHLVCTIITAPHSTSSFLILLYHSSCRRALFPIGVWVAFLQQLHLPRDTASDTDTDSVRVPFDLTGEQSGCFRCTSEAITADPHRSNSRLRFVSESFCSMKALDRNDYRRFDYVGSDSDEDSAGETHPAGSIEEIVRKLADSQGASAPGSANMSWNPVSDRIKIHPKDHSCPAGVYSDPDTWIAPPDPCESKLQHADTSTRCCRSVTHSG